jgi:thermospermine synthase
VNSKTLVTDGKTQSTQFDEFAYHESLVHPPLLKAAALAAERSKSTTDPSNPIKCVFVGGGGELATVREILRHPSVERVVMVDIDATVVELCKIHLPEWGGHKVANNPRLELIIGDAYEYLKNTSEMFDAIIMDISDPIEAGPGIMLYTQEFYAHAKNLLHPIHGVFCTQAGMAESVPADLDTVAQNDPSCFAPICNTLNEVFDCVVPYSSNIPSFGSDWGYVMAFTNANVVNTVEAWSRVSQRGMIDELIEKYISGGAQSLQWYDEVTHLTMFNLAKPLRKYMTKDKRIMTKDNPIFMF